MEGQDMHVKFLWIIWSNEIKLGKNTLVVGEISNSSGQSSKKIGDFGKEIAWRGATPAVMDGYKFHYEAGINDSAIGP